MSKAQPITQLVGFSTASTWMMGPVVRPDRSKVAPRIKKAMKPSSLFEGAGQGIRAKPPGMPVWPARFGGRGALLRADHPPPALAVEAINVESSR